MRKKIAYCIIFTSALILQLSVIPVVFDGRHIPDLVLMLILAWSVVDGFFAFLTWAIFFGLYYDLVSYFPAGTHALIFLSVLYFVSFFSRRLTMDFRGIGALLFLIYVVVATVVSHFVIALTLSWKIDDAHNFWKVFGSFNGASLEIIYNAGIFLICLIIIKRVKQFYAID